MQTRILTCCMRHFCKSIPGIIVMKHSGYRFFAKLFCHSYNGHRKKTHREAYKPSSHQTGIHYQCKTKSIENADFGNLVLGSCNLEQRACGSRLCPETNGRFHTPLIFTTLVFRTFSSCELWGCWLEGRKT